MQQCAGGRNSLQKRRMAYVQKRGNALSMFGVFGIFDGSIAAFVSRRPGKARRNKSHLWRFQSTGLEKKYSIIGIIDGHACGRTQVFGDNTLTAVTQSVKSKSTVCNE